MRTHTSFQCFLTVFVLWFMNIGSNAHVFNENPPTKPTPNGTVENYSAAEMCSQYSKLIYRTVRDPVLLLNHDEYIKVAECFQSLSLITNVREARPKEFPHMALLGYSERPDDGSWKCAGSLISNRFVLSAAHCEHFGSSRNIKYATWARLGELDHRSDAGGARAMDYKIVERIINPEYSPPSLYHDIALFRLETDVVFSAYVRPICLNTDMLLSPPDVILTGWGRIDDDELPISRMLQMYVNTISAKECDNNFRLVKNRHQILSKGIVNKNMVCSGVQHGKGDCNGDLNGLTQIPHDNYKCMHSQIGISSYFGGSYCGDHNSSRIYTRVSNYISWIEKIVWPKV